MSRNKPNGSQGIFDVWDDIPLSLADDPEIELGDLDTLPPVGRQDPAARGLARTVAEGADPGIIGWDGMA